jgi:hypothetical protein
VSTPLSNSGGRKQPVNVYTVMMIVSFIMLLLACILMFMELRRYGGAGAPWNTQEAQPQQVRWVLPNATQWS